MSCYYKSLPWLIPQILLLSSQNSEVIIVSPWMDNIMIQPPAFSFKENDYNSPKMEFGQFLLILAKNLNIRTTLIVREKDWRLERLIKQLILNSPEHLFIKEVPYLHAKAVITDSFIIETSANILHTSFYRNVETCSLIPNPYHNARKWLKLKLNILI